MSLSGIKLNYLQMMIAESPSNMTRYLRMHQLLSACSNEWDKNQMRVIFYGEPAMTTGV